MTRALAFARVFGALVLTVSLVAAAPTQSLPFESVGSPGGHFSDGLHHPEPVAESGVIGNITISNIIPVCYYLPDITPSSDNTTVVVTSLLGQMTMIPVSWFIVHGCEEVGYFRAGLDPGTYSLTLSYCVGKQSGPYQPAGCPHAACGLQSCNLPITIDVRPGKFTPVSIDITTGIY